MKMPGVMTGTSVYRESEVRYSTSIHKHSSTPPILSHHMTRQVRDVLYSPILPGLSDDVARSCLALVPRSSFPSMGGVCKQWRSFIQSNEFITERKQVGRIEEWLYVLTEDAKGSGRHWEILGRLGHGQGRQLLPPMPGPDLAQFGVVVLGGKLLILAGYFVDEGSRCVSAEGYQYDSCLNRWSKLASMNVARYDFACAEVDGWVYVVGGHGSDDERLSSAEVYDPRNNTWTLIESLPSARWGCFAYGFEGKLYVMGGRSSSTIGNSRYIDVYDPKGRSWFKMKNGCVMVIAHAELGKKLFCVEWKDQRKLAIFDPKDNSWKRIPIPSTRSSNMEFRFGIFDEKLLFFSSKKEPGYETMLYDPNAAPGFEWRISSIKPSGKCLCTATIQA